MLILPARSPAIIPSAGSEWDYEEDLTQYADAAAALAGPWTTVGSSWSVSASGFQNVNSNDTEVRVSAAAIGLTDGTWDFEVDITSFSAGSLFINFVGGGWNPGPTWTTSGTKAFTTTTSSDTELRFDPNAACRCTITGWRFKAA